MSKKPIAIANEPGVFICITCETPKFWYELGVYPDGKTYCLQKDNIGANCYKNRVKHT